MKTLSARFRPVALWTLLLLPALLLLSLPGAYAQSTAEAQPEEEVLPAFELPPVEQNEILLATQGPAKGWPTSLEDLRDGTRATMRVDGPAPRSLIFFLGRYEEGRLVDSYMSEVVEVDGETVQMKEVPRGDLILGDANSPREVVSPIDTFIPGGMFFPTEQNEQGAPVEQAKYMQEWDTELGDVEVDWGRQQALVIAVMPYGEDDRLRARSRPLIVLFDAAR